MWCTNNRPCLLESQVGTNFQIVQRGKPRNWRYPKHEAYAWLPSHLKAYAGRCVTYKNGIEGANGRLRPSSQRRRRTQACVHQENSRNSANYRNREESPMWALSPNPQQGTKAKHALVTDKSKNPALLKAPKTLPCDAKTPACLHQGLFYKSSNEQESRRRSHARAKPQDLARVGGLSMQLSVSLLQKTCNVQECRGSS